MDKKTKKELERLEALGLAERKLLKGIYGDMFGSSSETPKKEDAKSSSKGSSSREKSAAELLDEARKKRSDPLEDARKALKEAEELMARTDEITQGITNTNKKGLDELAGMVGNTGSADPSLMSGNPTLVPGQIAKGAGEGGQPTATATGGPAEGGAGTWIAAEFPLAATAMASAACRRIFRCQ